MLKWINLIFILMTSHAGSLFAQELRGIVNDVNSRLPIANAQIITAKTTILTNNEGRFVLKEIKIGAIIAVRLMGYETIEIAVDKVVDTLQIYLKQDPIALKEIEVRTKRNFKFDSLALRKEYAKAFVYKGPGISDMFITRDINYDSPFGFANPRSTASLVSLNVLQVINLLGKKRAQNTRLKQTLLRDEENNYIDHVFSKDKIKLLTGMEGEKLIRFMERYRPSNLALRKMTSYELNLYIKISYAEFVKINH